MRRRTALLCGTILLAAGLTLRRFPPEQYSFYPRCPVYTWLHVLCPGCGGTRALAAVLRGDLAEAIAQNALLTGLLPLLATYVAICCLRAWRHDQFRWPQPPQWSGSGLLAATVVFTIVRNLVR